MCFRTRRNELDGEVFEMLFTFSDFTAFKEMFLDYKAVSNCAYCSLVILMKSFL
jgi:ADP-ribosylation factor 2-binding protein